MNLFSFIIFLMAISLLPIDGTDSNDCSWMIERNFDDFSQLGGFILEYTLGRGLPNAEFVLRIVLEKGEENGLMIVQTWNARLIEVSDPLDIEGHPDEVLYNVLLRTVGSWEVDSFGFKTQTKTRHVSHKIVECAEQVHDTCGR